jgi:hypothetical protein
LSQKCAFDLCKLNEDVNAVGGSGRMADKEAVYRYGSTKGEVVDRHEIGPDTHLPSVGDTIMLSDSGSERRFVVKYRFPPSHSSLEREGVVSAYTFVVENAYR